MGTLREYMNQAADWLISIRNEDGGWGLYEDSGSRLINTAEAILALDYAGFPRIDYDSSLQYLQDVVLGKHELKAQYQRHFAWVGYTLVRLGETGVNRAVELCFDHLLDFQNSDGGWSHFPEGPSHTYATYLAMRAFLEAARNNSRQLDVRRIRERIDQATLWFTRVQNNDYGWGFSSEDASNVAATAFGTLALVDKYYRGKLGVPVTDRTVTSATKFLYENVGNTRKVVYEPNVGGDFEYPFHHFATPWVLSALVQAGYPIYDSALWNELLYLLSLRFESGGWSESPNIRPTVWATHNTLHLFKSLVDSFNPSDQLLAIVQAKIEVEKKLDLTKEQIESAEQEAERRVKALQNQISELQSSQRERAEEKKQFVEIGYKRFRILVSKPLFWIAVSAFLMSYISFVSLGRSISQSYKIVGFVAAPVISYSLSHVIGEQILKWSTENAVQFGLAIAGLVITIHLAFVGLN